MILGLAGGRRDWMGPRRLRPEKPHVDWVARSQRIPRIRRRGDEVGNTW